MQELFPHSDYLAALVSSLSEECCSDDKSSSQLNPTKAQSGLVVVASLLSKFPNLGGKICCCCFYPLENVQ